jgi:hypothetical protein
VHVSVVIARAPEDVYAFASDPTNLPRWAAGLARSEVRRDGDAWIVDAPFGTARVRFAERNAFGIMDHDVELESGVTVHNPMRVIPSGEGSELVFTLIRRPGVSDAQFAEDRAAVEHDLQTLREILERTAASRTDRAMAGPPRLEFLAKLVVDVGEVVSMGTGPLGERRVVGILGGSFEGPGMRGEVLPGADWQIARADGVLDIDAQYALREAGGSIVRVVSQGYRHAPSAVLEALARGVDVDPAQYFFRTIMRFETGAPYLERLNRTIAVATAQRKARQVWLDAYRLL